MDDITLCETCKINEDDCPCPSNESACSGDGQAKVFSEERIKSYKAATPLTQAQLALIESDFVTSFNNGFIQGQLSMLPKCKTCGNHPVRYVHGGIGPHDKLYVRCSNSYTKCHRGGDPVPYTQWQLENIR